MIEELTEKENKRLNEILSAEPLPWNHYIDDDQRLLAIYSEHLNRTELTEGP